VLEVSAVVIVVAAIVDVGLVVVVVVVVVVIAVVVGIVVVVVTVLLCVVGVVFTSVVGRVVVAVVGGLRNITDRHICEYGSKTSPSTSHLLRAMIVGCDAAAAAVGRSVILAPRGGAFCCRRPAAALKSTISVTVVGDWARRGGEVPGLPTEMSPGPSSTSSSICGVRPSSQVDLCTPLQRAHSALRYAYINSL